MIYRYCVGAIRSQLKLWTRLKEIQSECLRWDWAPRGKRWHDEIDINWSPTAPSKGHSFVLQKKQILANRVYNVDKQTFYWGPHPVGRWPIASEFGWLEPRIVFGVKPRSCELVGWRLSGKDLGTHWDDEPRAKNMRFNEAMEKWHVKPTKAVVFHKKWKPKSIPRNWL